MGSMRKVEEYVRKHQAALKSRLKAAFAVVMSFHLSKMMNRNRLRHGKR
jgi:menaquinone-dependent protoporphyrinogen IX oxidase